MKKSVNYTEISSQNDSCTNEDEIRLRELGYKQELKRSINILSNVGLSFTMLSIPGSLLPFFSFLLQTGGPRGMLLSWPVVSFFSVCVGLSMSEIVSAYPTSGGLYFWCAKLSSPKWAPFISYYSAWFNFLGLWGITSGTIYE
jgi:amino acid transporter